MLQRIVTGTDVTKNVNKNNVTHAVLFEAINLVIHLGHTTELRGSRFAPRPVLRQSEVHSPGAPPRRAHSSAFSCATAPARCRRRRSSTWWRTPRSTSWRTRHAVVGFARLCRMVVCGEFVFFLAHLFWPSSLGEGGYTALEALAVAV